MVEMRRQRAQLSAVDAILRRSTCQTVAVAYRIKGALFSEWLPAQYSRRPFTLDDRTVLWLSYTDQLAQQRSCTVTGRQLVGKPAVVSANSVMLDLGDTQVFIPSVGDIYKLAYDAEMKGNDNGSSVVG